jgi:DNA polymerase-3 subunit delta'
VPFDHIRGQASAVATLERALESGHVHHAYRFEGIDGVGKEMAAFALAQALLCTAGNTLGCGGCDSCRRVVQLSEDEPRVPKHPDVVLVARGLYPPSTIGRSSQEVSEISVHQIRRVVLSQAGYSPHEGRARVFIIRSAEQLRVEAANALLKTLEEPRADTHFVLLTASPERLLDTIRSRSMPIRFGPLPDEVLADVLRARGLPDDRIDGLLPLAGGSASAALSAADPEQSEGRDGFVDAMHEAVAASTMGPAVALSEGCARDRRVLAEHLAALAASYAREARRAVDDAPAAAELAARRHALVLEAKDALERNASATLTIATLLVSLRHGYQRRRQGAPPVMLSRR